MTRILIEAEQMVLNGYGIETNGDVDASGGQLIKLADSTGSASLDFTVAQAGTYDLTVWYYDENDGSSTVEVKVGSTIESWKFDEKTDNGRPSKGNRRSRVIKGVALVAGTNTLHVSGNVNEGESSRFDAFEFVSSTGSSSSGGTTGSSSTTGSSTVGSFTTDDSSTTGNTPILKAGGKLVVEAEDMALSDYKVESSGDASGGKLIKLANSTGTASLTFSVEEAGTYD
ncbi:MAG: hypothetical protein WBD47_14480, partial [Phormidesmis sp.]